MATIYTRASKGSALTWAEGDANITNLNNDKIEAVADDLTPQLGGDLDVNTHSIVSTANGDITIAPNGTGITVLQSDVEVGYGTSRAAITSSGTYALDLVTNGGVNSGVITVNPGANANIEITPNGTGKISLDNLLWPNADGTANQVLKTDGSGNLSWTTVSSGATTLDGLSDVAITTPSTGEILIYSGTEWINGAAGIDAVVDDTAPQLGGNLDVNGNSIVSVSNGNIVIAPNGTGKTVVSAINYNEGAIYDLGTTGGTIAPNVTNGNVQKITLNSALTINGFTSPVAGQSLTLIIYGGTAYTSITSTMKFAGGVKTLTGTAGCIDILSVYYDGTNYFASLAKGFA